MAILAVFTAAAPAAFAYVSAAAHSAFIAAAVVPSVVIARSGFLLELLSSVSVRWPLPPPPLPCSPSPPILSSPYRLVPLLLFFFVLSLGLWSKL
jgi:hypothetical protein